MDDYQTKLRKYKKNIFRKGLRNPQWCYILANRQWAENEWEATKSLWSKDNESDAEFKGGSLLIIVFFIP